MSFQTRNSHFQNTNEDIFDEIWELSDLQQCNGPVQGLER